MITENIGQPEKVFVTTKETVNSFKKIGIVYPSIFANVDAGKTTTEERIRELTERLHKIGEIHEGASTTDFTLQESDSSRFPAWARP